MSHSAASRVLRRLSMLGTAAALVLGAACGSETALVEAPTSPLPATATDAPSDPVDGPVRFLDQVPAMHPSIDGWAAVEVEVASPDGERWLLPVRLADDSAKRSHGLMEVTEVPVGTGMLFVFEVEGTGGFWMRNTLVPLDIAYIDAAGSVVTTHRMVPCPGDPCPSYPPSAPYLTTLEVPAGFWDLIGLEVGWTIRQR